ncbi:hypothetical protein TNIN_360131, partial [Trichonephila inaurata madagascariensis]
WSFPSSSHFDALTCPWASDGSRMWWTLNTLNPLRNKKGVSPVRKRRRS